MRATTTIAILSVLTLVSLTDSVSAGLFRRMRSRRRAAVQAQISHDVSRHVAGAEQRLGADLDEKVKVESAKLGEQVEAELANLRKQAADLIAAESKKLQQQMAKEISAMRVTATESIAAESKKLRQQINDQVATLQSQADKRLQDAVADLDARAAANLKKIEKLAANNSQDMQTGIADEVVKLKADLKDMIEDQVAALQSDSSDKKAPEPTAPAAPPEQGIQTEPARLQEEKQDS